MGKPDYAIIYLASMTIIITIHHFGISKIPVNSTIQILIDMVIFTFIMGFLGIFWEKMDKNKKKKK